MAGQSIFDEVTSALGGSGAVQDFLNRFGSENYTNQDAQAHYDQMQGHPELANAQNEYLSQMPPDQFGAAAEQAASQMPPQQQQDVAGGLLGALQGRGFDLGSLASMIGLSSTSPQQMGPQDLVRLLGWTQQNQPDALHEAVADKPWFVQALGSPVVQGILGNLASRLLNRA